MTWTMKEAIELCQRIESIAEKYGAHVALTGGTLYKSGERKDVDILFYRIRQQDSIRAVAMCEELYDVLGINIHACFGWVVKATMLHPITGEINDIDFFFPEDRKHDIPVTFTEEQAFKYGW